MSLPLLSSLLIGSLALVGIAIGMFYRKKFGESTHGWTLGVGAVLGAIGCACYFRSALVANLIMLVGGVFLVVGSYWLWYVMLGSRK